MCTLCLCKPVAAPCCPLPLLSPVSSELVVKALHLQIINSYTQGAKKVPADRSGPCGFVWGSEQDAQVC